MDRNSFSALQDDPGMAFVNITTKEGANAFLVLLLSIILPLLVLRIVAVRLGGVSPPTTGFDVDIQNVNGTSFSCFDANNSNTEEEPDNTEEEANAFLERVFCSGNFFSFCVKEIRKLRKKTRLNFDDEERLEGLYDSFCWLAVDADREIFREKIPESEIQGWLDLVIDEIKSITTKQSWISTGRLDKSDSLVLQSCDCMLRLHVVPVYLAFKSDFFQVLADFIKARKAHGGRALPDVTICDYIGRIVSLSLETAVRHFGDRWPEEKIFKELEASGILEEFLRCYTVPQPLGSFPEECWYTVLERLVSCPDILTRKFKSGKPCGDTLKAILDGKDGSRDIPPRILNRLKGMSRLVEILVERVELLNSQTTTTCKYCAQTSETPLSECSGCRLVGYCSKECQKADWEIHKETCQKTDKKVSTRAMLIIKFVDENSESIYQAICETCNSTGVEASDLAVEVDFMPDENGIIPAFHDPPMFRIVLVDDYISGHEVPEWLRGDKVSDGRPANFKDWVQRFMTEDRSTTSASLLVNYASVHSFFPGYFHS